MTTICVPDAEARELLGELPPGMQAVTWDGSGQPPPGSEDVTFLVARYALHAMASDALAQLPALRVIQLQSAGVEAWLDRVPEGVVLCNARGVHGGSTAELAVAGILSVLRQLPHFVQTQAAHEWARTDTDGLDGKRVLILGAGDIGRRVAAAVTVFDAQVTFVARRARDEVHGLAELPDLLPQHDIVVVAVPHTPETEGFFDASKLRL
ncbi:MAG: NAD(P)-dependent oxidoreductase, partial [Pseudonocardiales bacterium]